RVVGDNQHAAVLPRLVEGGDEFAFLRSIHCLLTPSRGNGPLLVADSAGCTLPSVPRRRFYPSLSARQQPTAPHPIAPHPRQSPPRQPVSRLMLALSRLKPGSPAPAISDRSAGRPHRRHPAPGHAPGTLQLFFSCSFIPPSISSIDLMAPRRWRPHCQRRS